MLVARRLTSAVSQSPAIRSNPARSTMHFKIPLRRSSLALAVALALQVAATAAAAHSLEPLPSSSIASDQYQAMDGAVASDQISLYDESWLPTGNWLASPLIFGKEIAVNESPSLPWMWQIMPEGLVWRSYLAGVKEPRLSVVSSDSSLFGTIWDANMGGRVSLIRYGTPSAYRPEGWEFQIEAAAQPRIWPNKFSAPLISTDYRVGLPLVYAQGKWQFKTGYYHISAHLGDEYMELNPSVDRINYMRDALMLAVGYYYTDNLRLFAETDWAFGADGGAQPWEFQFGADYSPAVRGGAPFAAVYGNLRQELDYGGFFVLQAGWQWRGGAAMKTFRLGVEYINGGSQQYEFYNQFEQQTGFGIWYDY